jgi:hypothetical protein
VAGRILAPRVNIVDALTLLKVESELTLIAAFGTKNADDATIVLLVLVRTGEENTGLIEQYDGVGTWRIGSCWFGHSLLNPIRQRGL